MSYAHDPLVLRLNGKILPGGGGDGTRGRR
jgi:hypothetical protein